MVSQMQELVIRVRDALREPWNKKVGRRRSLGLYRAVEVSCMYIRHNATQEFIGDVCDVAQPTVSRTIRELVPVVKRVLAEFVPDVAEAIQIVDGRVCLVDGTIVPCWSYDGHGELWSRKHGTTGFNAQLVCLLDGTPVYISDPLDGRTHDAKAFTATDAEEIIANCGGAFADKGYEGCEGVITPRKTPRGGALSESDKQNNAELSSFRSAVERFVAQFKSWRIFHTDYRRPYNTYRDTFDAGRALFFFSITWSFE